MNKKERVLAAINFKSIDRIPSAYRAIDVLTESIIKYFKIEGFDTVEDFGAIKRNREMFLEKIGADFWSDASRLGKFSSFSPKYIGPPPGENFIMDKALFYTLGIKTRVSMVSRYNYGSFMFVDPPLANIERAADLEEGFLTSKLDLYDFKSYSNRLTLVGDSENDRERSQKLNQELSYQSFKNSKEDFICMGSLNNFFMTCCYLRGMENFFLDLAFNLKLAESIIKEVGDFCLEFSRRELLEFGRKAEFYCSWDDFAGQQNVLVSPEILKKYFFPLYVKLANNVKKYDLVYMWHCCGSVHDVLPLMIEAGIDVFDTCQTSAKDMDLENIYNLYGKNVCIHGAIDVQDLLINKSPKEIKREVRKIKDLWGKRGGIIITPAHETLPETRIENVLSIYEAINED